MTWGTSCLAVLLIALLLSVCGPVTFPRTTLRGPNTGVEVSVGLSDHLRILEC
jgi:hypothetical protein